MTIIKENIKQNKKNIDFKNQNHLKYHDKINLWAFYTPIEYIDIVWNMIKPFLNNKSVVLDNSCWYGSFFWL